MSIFAVLYYNPHISDVHSDTRKSPVYQDLQFRFKAESMGSQVGYGSSHAGHGGG